MSPQRKSNLSPFEELDNDWAITCRRHRRSSAVIARWASAEPDLAHLKRLDDLVPPIGSDIDRTPLWDALVQLHRTGDDLAARGLLQLLVPGMVCLTARWQERRLFESTRQTCWEVITRSQLYISRLRHREINPNPGYVLRCVRRDLINEDLARIERTVTEAPENWALVDESDSGHWEPSAEDIVCANQLTRDLLRAAADRAVLPDKSIDTVWHLLCGCSLPEAARATEVSVPTAYRHLDRALPFLRRQLIDAHGLPAATGPER